MGSLHAGIDRLHHWGDRFPFLTRLLVALLVLAFAGAVARLVNGMLRRAYLRRLSRQSGSRAADLERNKRQQTLLTLLESLVRYAVYGAAVFVAITMLWQGAAGAASAVFGASVILGLGLQRLLNDVFAGGLLLFEGDFAVGDFVEVGGAKGIVEEFSLRTTVLRTLSGDRVVVLNGSISSFTNFARNYRELHLELLVSDAAAAREAIARVIERTDASSHRRFLRGPHLVSFDDLAGGLARAELAATVPPTLEWLVETSLVAQLERELGDVLVAPIDVFDVDEASFQAYRNAVLVEH